MQLPFAPTDVSRRLLAWYGENGRDLPWRQTRDPYRIWISEIMLQQTTVAAVIPYYERFLERFPDIRALAAAPQEEVLRCWAGLGYYSRARNLHAAARHLVAHHDGMFPETVDELLRLPGVGRSTAGAIRSIAFDRPAPILDGNVRRVLVRLMALRRPPREREAEKLLWQWAEMLTPDDRPHDYAQAIMDLGATICQPCQPRCQDCPLRDLCRARAEGLEDALPVSAKKAAVPTRRQLALLVHDNGRLLLRRRPARGLLGGMWEFPCLDVTDAETPERRLSELLNRYSPGERAVYLGPVRHAYSHFRLELDAYMAPAAGGAGASDEETFWEDGETAAAGPLHGAHRKILHLLTKVKSDD